jgi:hypothetical protein
VEKEKHLKGFLKEQFKTDGLKVELTSRMAIQYSYYHKMKFDVKNILEILEILKQIDSNKEIIETLPFSKNQKILLRQSLWVNTIVSYAKFFTSKDKDEADFTHIQFQEKKCYKGARPELFNMHNKIMVTRHKCISHGVENEEEHVIPYLYLVAISHDGVTSQLGVNVLGPINYSFADLNLFTELVKLLDSYIETKMGLVSEKVYKELGNISPNDLLDLALQNKSL